VDAALEKRQVKRAYKIYAPAYDFVFDWIFHPGREQAIRLLDIKGGEQILEVGIGTGLNLPLYPANCRITGIDLSEEMLEKAQDKVVELGLNNVTLKAMDATVMDFATASSTRRWRPTPSARCLTRLRCCARCAGSAGR
jgi:phosphatidylethanolamine/phosphatidyl-N-methylethanolamine N-methyltransferase